MLVYCFFICFNNLILKSINLCTYTKILYKLKDYFKLYNPILKKIINCITI